MANWTRGVAKRDPRRGPVGKHTLEIADAISFKYLNIQQSPIPWGDGLQVHLQRHEGQRPAGAGIDWPANVAPTLDAKTTLRHGRARGGHERDGVPRADQRDGDLEGRASRRRA